MLVPFVVIIDTREQAPFRFQELKGNAGRHVLSVPVLRRTLPSGDYSIDGHEDAIAIERKSLPDLFQSLGKERNRFQREIKRLARMRFAAVVVEADWQTVLTEPPAYSLLPPKTVHRTILAWQLAYPSVHWWLCPNRRFAEITTFRLLERYWNWWDTHYTRWAIAPSASLLEGAACVSSSL